MADIIEVKKRVGGVYQTVYMGSDSRLAAAAVAKLITLTSAQLQKIGDDVYKQWVEEARVNADFPSPTSGSWRDVDYRADYIRGIQPPKVSDGKLQLTIAGNDALRVELGWAPPTTAHLEDGIGKYDGSIHDLRPWLMKFGRVHMHKEKGAYRNLRFIGPGMTKQIAKVVPLLEAQWKSLMVSEGKHVSERMQRRQHYKMLAVMRNVYANSVRRVGGSGEDDDGDDRSPGLFTAGGLKTKTNWHSPDEQDAIPTAAPHHKVWLYGNARPNATQAVDDHRWFVGTRKSVKKHVEGNRTMWKSFRTIWANPEINPDSFLTRGIKPARLISGKKSPVAKMLRDALRAVLLGAKG